VTCPLELTGPYAYDLNVQVLWVEAIADVQAPTPEEIATGFDLQAEFDLTDIVGWEIETDIIRDGSWGPFEQQRLGVQKIADSRLLFAADRAGDDIRVLLARGDTGFIVILPSGPYLDHPTAPVNVYPVIVAQLTQQQRLRTGGGSLILVTFAITTSQQCGENVLVEEGS
jgi:hypothetical protein